jgi:hypothetical protein
MSGSTAAMLAVHLSATAAMTGLIWFVQVVHYPLFRRVGSVGFVEYEQAHQRLTSWVVGPFMAVEGVSALVIAAVVRDEVGSVLPALGLVALAIVHASTVFLQVPAHRRLGRGRDADTVDRLVATNWIRTVGWSTRSIIAIAMLIVAAG